MNSPYFALALKYKAADLSSPQSLEHEFQKSLFALIQALDSFNAPLEKEELPLSDALGRLMVKVNAIESPFLAIDALKQAVCGVLSADTPHEVLFLDRMEGASAHPFDQSSAFLAREAAHLSRSDEGEFTIADDITGVLADSLNITLQNPGLRLFRRARIERIALHQETPTLGGEASLKLRI